jgi:hypothetical protein
MSDYLDAVAAHMDRTHVRCDECGQMFERRRSWQRYCDAVCARLGGVKRVRAARAANRYRGGCS